MENNNASASDPEPQQASEAPPAPRPPPEDTGKKVLNSQGVEVSKWSIRSGIWDKLESNDLVNFPRPCNNRIPNFVDAAVAAEKLAELEQFKSAHTIKINPDKPQENARFLTLEANKTLLVPTPRLRSGLFNKITPPEDANKEMLRKCSTALGTKEHSKRISLKDEVTVDLVIVGSVAVSEEGYRIGKGEGFADLEWAMMATMGAVGPDTVVVTTVHDEQLVEIPEDLLEDHDLTVDFIVTPTRVIETNCKRPKPLGINWSQLDYDKLYRIPVLRKLRDMEREDGKDVRLKGQEGDNDDELEERMDQERRGNYRGGRGGNRGMGRRPFRGRRGGGGGGGRFGRRRPRQDDSADQGDESNKENADESNGEGTGERGGRRRRQYRNRGYRRAPGKPRQSESELSDGAGGDQDGGEEEGGEKDRRPQRPRRNRRPRGMGARNDAPQDNSDGENRRSDGDENRTPRPPRRPRVETSPDGVVFVGGISRRLRVSEFKTEMRGCDVHPVRLVWRGGRGFAFLHFTTADSATTAVKALAGLEIDGRELNVEMARQENRPRGPRGPGGGRRNPKEAGSTESANQESVGSSDLAVEGGDR